MGVKVRTSGRGQEIHVINKSGFPSRVPGMQSPSVMANIDPCYLLQFYVLKFWHNGGLV